MWNREVLAERKEEALHDYSKERKMVPNITLQLLCRKGCSVSLHSRALLCILPIMPSPVCTINIARLLRYLIHFSSSIISPVWESSAEKVYVRN